MLAFLITKTFQDVNAFLGTHVSYWAFAGNCAFAVLFVLFFVPETKGKTLDEIQKELRKR
jgi:hypothetical protein